MPKVSVIMPCLNMAKYIEECIKSVVYQTLADIEILIIDAGSTDGTLDILQSYKIRDQRIKIINSHKRSYGYQVNLGISAATGEYIGIVDTDDRIQSDMYEVLYSIASEENADYAKGTGELFFTLAKENVYKYAYSPFPCDVYGEEGRIEVCPHEMPDLLPTDNFLWNGIYRSDFLKNIRLHESPGAAFQDLGGLLQTQINAHKAIYINKIVYEYRQDNMGASIYNKNGIHFVEDEYLWAAQFLDGQPAGWHTAFYRKQFGHFVSRLEIMAALEVSLKDAWKDILIITRRLKWANEQGILTEKNLTEEQWENLQLLWKNPYLLFDKYRNVFTPNKRLMGKIIKNLEDKPGIIFGSGRLGKFVHAQLLYRNHENIVAYCDNNEMVQGNIQYGVEVLDPEQSVKKFPQSKYIIANKYHAAEMKIQLEKMGIKKEDIMVYSLGTNIHLFGMKLFEDQGQGA